MHDLIRTEKYTDAEVGEMMGCSADYTRRHRNKLGILHRSKQVNHDYSRACNLVRAGYSVRHAAITTGIPQSTLYTRINQRTGAAYNPLYADCPSVTINYLEILNKAIDRLRLRFIGETREYVNDLEFKAWLRSEDGEEYITKERHGKEDRT